MVGGETLHVDEICNGKCQLDRCTACFAKFKADGGCVYSATARLEEAATATGSDETCSDGDCDCCAAAFVWAGGCTAADPASVTFPGCNFTADCHVWVEDYCGGYSLAADCNGDCVCCGACGCL